MCGYAIICVPTTSTTQGNKHAAGIVCRRDINDVITTIPADMFLSMAGESDLSFRYVAAGWEGIVQP